MMALKQIKIREAVYKQLDSFKRDDESYSIAIQNLIDENKRLKAKNDELREDNDKLMVIGINNMNEIYFEKVNETNDELRKLKGKWEIENKTSGRFEIPENILSLEGVEYLLKLNIFNEVPTVLSFVAPSIVEYSFLFDPSDYSEDKYDEYVEKGTEIIERLLGLYKELGINLEEDNSNLILASKFYISYLSNKIGKSDEYYCL